MVNRPEAKRFHILLDQVDRAGCFRIGLSEAESNERSDWP